VPSAGLCRGYDYLHGRDDREGPGKAAGQGDGRVRQPGRERGPPRDLCWLPESGSAGTLGEAAEAQRADFENDVERVEVGRWDAERVAAPHNGAGHLLELDPTAVFVVTLHRGRVAVRPAFEEGPDRAGPLR